MKTIVVIEVNHAKEIPALGEMIAWYANQISGVAKAEPVADMAALPVLWPERLRVMRLTETKI